VNRHLIFTHGLGAVVSPVGGVAPDGSPLYLVKDIPPVGEPKIDQPRVYYGELTSDYVIVDTNQDEFDYTTDQGTVQTRFNGQGGVGVGDSGTGCSSPFAWATRTSSSRTSSPGRAKCSSIARSFHAKKLIAPFLEYDPDPYLVIANGKMYWINDAFTTGDRYPTASASRPSARPARRSPAAASTTSATA